MNLFGDRVDGKHADVDRMRLSAAVFARAARFNFTWLTPGETGSKPHL